MKKVARVSRNRQLAIPVAMYTKMGKPRKMSVELTDEGLIVRPIQPVDEMMGIIAHLKDSGLDDIQIKSMVSTAVDTVISTD